jgi:hypothetical protein
MITQRRSDAEKRKKKEEREKEKGSAKNELPEL